MPAAGLSSLPVPLAPMAVWVCWCPCVAWMRWLEKTVYCDMVDLCLGSLAKLELHIYGLAVTQMLQNWVPKLPLQGPSGSPSDLWGFQRKLTSCFILPSKGVCR